MARKRIKVILSSRAEQDLLEIYRYLSEHAPAAIIKVDSKLFKALRRLERFPATGRWVPEFVGKHYREIRVFHYRIIYRFVSDKNRVEVLTIYHGRRLLPSAL